MRCKDCGTTILDDEFMYPLFESGVKVGVVDRRCFEERFEQLQKMSETMLDELA
jgi:hypothetical protein